MAGNAIDMENVRPLRPPRVLLAVADRRFVRVASFLFARHGFEVASTNGSTELLDLLDERAPDAVILDGTESFGEAARLAGAIEGLHPNVTVIVLAEERVRAPLSNVRILPKWNSFDQLVLNIARRHLGLAS
jgi:hypothetical protein